MFARPKSSVFIDAVIFEVEHNDDSTALKAVLKDESGSIICSLLADVPEGKTHYRWHGLDELPYGVYVLEMQEGEKETRMRMVKRI
jgi:hypothetical protein